VIPDKAKEKVRHDDDNPIAAEDIGDLHRTPMRLPNKDPFSSKAD
jgi:hypothetical protein